MLHFKTFRTRSIGWALYGVNFRPLQEIETIMGGGRIFDTGPFFVRLRYINCCHCCWLCDHMYMYVDHYSLPLHLLWFQLPLLKLIVMEHAPYCFSTSQLLQVSIHILILWYCTTWKYLASFPGPTQLSTILQLGEPTYFGICLTVISVGEGAAWCNLERICTSDRCLWRL